MVKDIKRTCDEPRFLKYFRRKALFFIEDNSFRYDNRVIRETDTLIKAGWDITVVSPKSSEDPLFKKTSKNLRVYSYPKPNARSSIGHIFEHAITLFFAGPLVVWIFLRHGFSVFHACNPMDILWIAALPFKLIGVKFIFDQHDLCPEIYLSRGDGTKDSLFYKILIFLEKKSYRLADAVIATNESYKKVAINRGGKGAEQIFVVRNGPDLRKFQKVSPKKDLKKTRGILVGYLGEMNIQDGVDYLLEVANRVIEIYKRKDINFIFVGGGSCQHELRYRSKQMGLSDYVTFTGRIPSFDEALSILKACDICVQPDPLNPLNDKSTMNKAMEYMAIGKPVIAFDLKETRVSCGDAALYVKPNDIVEFTEKLLYLADSPSTRNKMGKIGRTRIEEKLCWDYAIPHLLDAYAYATSSFPKTGPVEG